MLTSPLHRARQTSVLTGFDDYAQPDSGSPGMDYGAYEGRHTAKIGAERPGWRLFEDGCSEGKSLQTMNIRAEHIIGRIRALGSNVLNFSHRDILHSSLSGDWACRHQRSYTTPRDVNKLQGSAPAGHDKSEELCILGADVVLICCGRSSRNAGTRPSRARAGPQASASAGAPASR